MIKVFKRLYVTASNYPLMAKNVNVLRQGKIMNKLFGERVSGSKRHWIPHDDYDSTEISNKMNKSALFGKPQQKQTVRRISVLNKLFMKNITDFLATGSISDLLLGRGLQITRVKVSPDFAYANVWWRGTGAATADKELEIELKRCSGILRHELSQLNVMGQVPLIKFVRDRTFSNIEMVDNILKNVVDERMIVGDGDGDGDGNKRISLAELKKSEFYGIEEPTTNATASETVSTKTTVENFPKMRHDVLGLDHRDITTRILAKMRKSKEAWELHYNNTANNAHRYNLSQTTRRVDEINQQIKKRTNVHDSDEEFSRYLSTRNPRRPIRERKRYRGNEHTNSLDDNDYDAALLSPEQKKLYDEYDYIHEDDDHKNK